ncbi:MAG: TetR/AcrR family transcriptional regulator [Clostridiales bacterium]|nr:TetR/AcrR family transcriptional regulator [Clostridiales bacterium]
MPPKIQYTKGDLLQAAFRLTRAQGLSAVNARAVARELGCSTQPIFRAFHSMEDIRREMLRMAADVYQAYLLRGNDLAPKPYLGSGMAYILFAREERELFRLLFMRDRLSEGDADPAQDQTLEYVLGLVMQSTGLDRGRALAFHRHLWVFTHGLAAMVATRYLKLEDAEVMNLLRDQYRATRLMFGLPPVQDAFDEAEGRTLRQN